MARLSIVIPVLRQLDRLEDTLISVLENRPADCQIVVVLNEPYNDPYQLSGEVCFIQAAAGSSFADTLNLGVVASRAPIVHLLACGAEATPGWTEEVLRHFDDPQVAVVAPLVLDRFPPRRLISAGLAYGRSGAMGRLCRGRDADAQLKGVEKLAAADILAGFYRKTAVELVGRFAQGTTDLAAAVDLGLALRRAGYRGVLEPQSLTYADPSLAQAKRAACRGYQAEQLFWRWASERGPITSIAAHAGLLAWEAMQTIVRPANIALLGGRLFGALRTRRPVPRPLVTAPVVHARNSLIRPPHFPMGGRDSRKQPAAQEVSG